MATSVSLAPARPAVAGDSAREARRYELDWLRAFVVLGLIPVHAIVIFSSTSDVYLKNSETNSFMALLAVFAEAWGMPLLFAVAGAGAWFALKRRAPRRYLIERVKRLIVPFIVASLTIIPIEIYAILMTQPGLVRSFNIPIHDPNYMSSLLTFYAEYLRGYGYFLTHFSLELAIIFWGHLWFIPRLFIYALITLPLFLWLQGPRGNRARSALSRLFRLPGAIFLFGLPLAFMELFTRAVDLRAFTADWPFYDDWTQFAFFLIFFIYGYLMFDIPGMRDAIRRSGWVALALGMAGFALALVVKGISALAANPLGYSLGDIINLPIRDFVSWFWVVAILSFAMRRLAFTNRLLRYLNEAAFPIYVIHMPILTVVAVYALPLALPWALKLALIIVVALGVTLALYEYVIRRIGVLRLLLGMKRPQPALALAAAGAADVERTRKEQDMRDDVSWRRESWGRAPASSFAATPARSMPSASVPARVTAITFTRREHPALPPAPERTVVEMFRERSVRFGDAPRWRARQDGAHGVWIGMTWGENQALVNDLISGLSAFGVQPGARVGILAETRWEWLAADWAILGLGAVTVPLYASHTADTVAYMLNDAQVEVVFVENAEQYAKIASMRASVPGLKALVMIEDEETAAADAGDGLRVISFAALRRLSGATPEQAEAQAARFAADLRPEQVASIIYTSGTTNRPKGAIHTHATLMAQVHSTGAALSAFVPGTTHLLWLPLAHVLGREEHLISVDRGGLMYIAESTSTLARDIREVHPNIIVGVPRIYEKAYATILAQATSGGGVKRSIFQWARSVGASVVERRQRGLGLPAFLRLEYTLADRLVFGKVREALGGKLIFSITGGAPIGIDILRFFHGAGVLILEGWGLTETMGAVAVNLIDRYRLGTVGPLTEGHEVRIAPDGEALLRGPCIFTGYLNNPAENAAALDSEGWLHTGDLGEVDADGFLRISGRKKELIVTANGKKIVPDPIETLLKAIPGVSQAAVYGDSKPYLVALLTLDPESVMAWAARQGVTASSAAEVEASPRFAQHLADGVARVNSQLARFETVKRYAVAPEDFTMENGLLTPTQKIKRGPLYAHYHDLIEGLYAGA